MCPAVVSGIVTVAGVGGGGGGRGGGGDALRVSYWLIFLFFLVPSNIPRSRYVS